MRTRRLAAISGSALLLLGACASTPMGPTVQVLPSPSKPFEVFQQDQVDCKQYAQAQVSGQADAANQKAVGTAVIGAALGTVLGAAVGNSRGAGVGAGAGAVVGTSAAAGQTGHAQRSIQEQYNNAFVQCMYSKGNQVPGAAPAGSVDLPPPAAPAVAAAPAAAETPAPAMVEPMTVAQVQQRLNALGYPVGPADGIMGPATREKLKAFQAARGLPSTGELDSNTVAALGH